MTKRIFISADHGMAIIYFLQSDVAPTLLNAGVEVIVLTVEAISVIAKQANRCSRRRVALAVHSVQIHAATIPTL